MDDIQAVSYTHLQAVHQSGNQERADLLSGDRLRPVSYTHLTYAALEREMRLRKEVKALEEQAKKARR